ncbi:MAG: hypothetical protein AAGE94_09195 [Acidobacteriota bacterium]
MKTLSPRFFLILAGCVLLLAAAAPAAQSLGNGNCRVDNINGNIQITPPGCSYSGPDDLVHGQGDLSWDPRHAHFNNVAVHAGGVLQGTVDSFDSAVIITVRGNGRLEGYESTVTIPAKCEAHAGPWSVDDQPISFQTEMMRLEGQLEDDGNSDFSYLRVVAGTEYGYPSPGHTTASTQDGKSYVVDSMFEMGFRIEYVGAPGGPLAGYEGAFEGTAVMKAFANPEGR